LGYISNYPGNCETQPPNTEQNQQNETKRYTPW
jgi:hypothetical protein